MADDHKLVAWMRDFAKDDAQLSDDAIKNRFLYLNDAQRTSELQAFSSWLDDDSTLRQKSQVMRLGQDLNRLHQAMRKAGR